jgi:hypothetical protein
VTIQRRKSILKIFGFSKSSIACVKARAGKKWHTLSAVAHDRAGYLSALHLHPWAVVAHVVDELDATARAGRVQAHDDRSTDGAIMG